MSYKELDFNVLTILGCNGCKIGKGKEIIIKEIYGVSVVETIYKDIKLLNQKELIRLSRKR